jgi:GNAT superfamily N-acetyltransferase
MTASRECRLADGRAVVLRLAGPGDVPAITKLYLELSPESFYRRFNTEQPAPALVAKLASFGSGGACLVAAALSDPSRVVAEARYVPIAPGTAELALTVLDSYQGTGMGHIMLDALVERAREEGLERLRAVVLLANSAMLRLLQAMDGCWSPGPRISLWPSWRFPPPAGCPAGLRAVPAGGSWWNGAAGSMISRSQRCARPGTTSASAPGPAGKPAGPARWSPLGTAGWPKRQT